MIGLLGVGLAAAALAVTSIWSTDEDENETIIDETPHKSRKRKRSNSPCPIPEKRAKRVRFCEKKNKVHWIAPRPPQRGTDSEENDDDEIDNWAKRLRVRKERSSGVKVTKKDLRKRKKN